MLEFKYSLKKDYPQWTNTKKFDDEKLFDKLNLKQIIDKIILTIETLEDDEVIKFELRGK